MDMKSNHDFVFLNIREFGSSALGAGEPGTNRMKIPSTYTHITEVITSIHDFEEGYD